MISGTDFRYRIWWSVSTPHSPRASLDRRVVRALRITTLAAVSLLWALVPGRAAAGTYTVYTCKDPNGVMAAPGWDMASRHGNGASSYFTGNACPGGYFWLDLVSNAEHSADDFARAFFTAPADTEITGYSIWRSVQLSSPYHYEFSQVPADGGGVKLQEHCYADAGCTSLGDWTKELPPVNLVQASGLTGIGELSFSIYCPNVTGSGAPCPPAAPAANFQIHRADVTLTDDMPPAFALPPSGPLLDTQHPLTGVKQVFVWAADRGSGVKNVLFEVDGAVVAKATLDDNDGQCQTPYTVPRPCPLEVRGTVSFNTATVLDGHHQLRLLVTDATDTNVAAWGPIPIVTNNGSCDPNPRSAAMKVRATFGGRGRRARVRTVRYGQQLRVRARVRHPDGTPAPGVPVCVAVRTAVPRASVRDGRIVATDAAGNVRAVIGRGPSRRVYFIVRGADGASVDSLLLKVRAPVSLRLSRHRLSNGQMLRFRGTVGGTPRPAKGVVVALEVKKGRSWQPFDNTHTLRRGRFSGRHRFTRTTGVQRYVFRARIPAQVGYPFAGGTSRPVAVVVRG